MRLSHTLIISALAALVAGSLTALATNTTIGVTAGSGSLANLISFVSGHVIAESGNCDATTENQCGAVKAGNTAATTDIAIVVSDPNVLAAVNATGTVQGGAANGVATLGNPLQMGCVAVSSETPVLAGQAASVVCGLERKVITLPYANKENMLRCAVAIAVNTATTCTGMGAQGAGLKIYITSLCITRNDAGTTAISATLNAQDTSATNNIIYDIPNNGGGGGICPPLPTPLVVAANTAFQVTMSAATTTVHVNATGYFGQ